MATIDINDIRNRSNLTWDEMDSLLNSEPGTAESIGAGVKTLTSIQQDKLHMLDNLLSTPRYDGQPAVLIRRRLITIHADNDESDLMRISMADRNNNNEENIPVSKSVHKTNDSHPSNGSPLVSKSDETKEHADNNNNNTCNQPSSKNTEAEKETVPDNDEPGNDDSNRIACNACNHKVNQSNDGERGDDDNAILDKIKSRESGNDGTSGEDDDYEDGKNNDNGMNGNADSDDNQADWKSADAISNPVRGERCSRSNKDSHTNTKNHNAESINKHNDGGYDNHVKSDSNVSFNESDVSKIPDEASNDNEINNTADNGIADKHKNGNDSIKTTHYSMRNKEKKFANDTIKPKPSAPVRLKKHDPDGAVNFINGLRRAYMKEFKKYSTDDGWDDLVGSRADWEESLGRFGLEADIDAQIGAIIALLPVIIIQDDENPDVARETAIAMLLSLLDYKESDRPVRLPNKLEKNNAIDPEDEQAAELFAGTNNRRSLKEILESTGMDDELINAITDAYDDTDEDNKDSDNYDDKKR